ncbi:MAG: 1-acyl-sn-glycerol-3-phosphate acyltransferase [Candidatus Cryptobacteroides sp.]
MNQTEFDDIRPYYDEEIPPAMRRIVEHPYFPLLASYVFPEVELDVLKEMFLSFKDINDFQVGVMKQVNEQIIRKTTTGFTYSGMERIDPGQRYLFVSNHRDIMLDASLLQYVLWLNGHQTTEITFGSNLMTDPLVVDIGKSNKMFKVERGGTAKEFYRSSAHLSDYIRYAVTVKKESVWIAQRNGRTKDGRDATDPGIVSMFSMSASDDKVKAIDSLNIVPVAVSYEWEPCDYAKAREVCISKDRKYVKGPGEDLQSILSGITGRKGRVHFSICAPLTYDEINACASEKGGARFNRAVASLIDSRIRQEYHNFPTNYAAYDILNGTERFKDRYTDGEKASFEARVAGLPREDGLDAGVLREVFLGIYANSVENQIPRGDSE